jgi:hypothetical protein
LNDQPSITVSGNVFTVTYFAGQAFSDLQLCYSNGALPFPFQYTMAFVDASFINDGGILQLSSPFDYPLLPDLLPPGAVWYNGGAISVIPGIVPNPSAPPVYFSTITPASLLALGGGDLPLSDPANLGQLWNNGGLITISAG